MEEEKKISNCEELPQEPVLEENSKENLRGENLNEIGRAHV